MFQLFHRRISKMKLAVFASSVDGLKSMA